MSDLEGRKKVQNFQSCIKVTEIPFLHWVPEYEGWKANKEENGIRDTQSRSVNENSEWEQGWEALKLYRITSIWKKNNCNILFITSCRNSGKFQDRFMISWHGSRSSVLLKRIRRSRVIYSQHPFTVKKVKSLIEHDSECSNSKCIDHTDEKTCKKIDKHVLPLPCWLLMRINLTN